jgi:hypothetical protein
MPQRPILRWQHRRGLTLLELLISTAMMLMLAGVLGGLAAAVQTSSDYSQGHGSATQQARVALERITRNVRQATAVGTHPGLAVVARQVNGWRFPETLIVWRPAGLPVNASGPPLVRELVFYCTDPEHPEQLLEVTAPQDQRALPLDAPLEQSPWREMIEAIKTDSGSRRVVLTNLLRTASAASNSNARPSDLLGAVRFEREMRPSAAEWSQYRAGTRTWDQLSWAQGIGGRQTGLRQAWLRIELQLDPVPTAADEAKRPSLTFLGSAALFYELER